MKRPPIVLAQADNRNKTASFVTTAVHEYEGGHKAFDYIYQRSDGVLVSLWYDFNIKLWTAYAIKKGYQAGPANYGYREELAYVILDAQEGTGYW